MRSHVARILKKPMKIRRMMSVTLDGEQMEMVEKLSLFFSRETHRTFSKNQVIEEAVRAFADESAEYITEEYDMDIRSITLTEMQEYKRMTSVEVAAFDTVILPAKDNESCRRALFEEHMWYPVQLNSDKLKQIQFVALYIGAPCSGITHYARILSYGPLTGDPKKQILRFEPPEELPSKIELGDMNAAGMRRPRYTTLGLMLEAKLMEDLF